MKSLDEVEARTPISSLPFIIRESGSYYLTRTLRGSPNQHGIVIETSNVTLDLNGYSLIGGAGSGSGVLAGSATERVAGLILRNGIIRGWGGDGVNLEGTDFAGQNSQLEELQVLRNGRHGLHLAGETIVRRCIVSENGGIGIRVLRQSVVADCMVNANGFGPQVNGRGAGILAFESAVRDCLVTFNSGHGIDASGSILPSLIAGNTLSLNGRTGPDGAGILAGSTARIEGNVLTQNGYGIRAGANSTANLIVRNYAAHNPLGNYSLQNPEHNLVGPVVQAPGLASNTNPDANYE
jgi:hypothetical protein